MYDAEVGIGVHTALGHFDPRETFEHQGAGIVAHAAGQMWIAKKLFEALTQRRDIARWREKASLAIDDDFAQAAHATRHDGSSRGHRF